MKRNMMMAAGTALVLAFFLNQSMGQDNPATPAPPPTSPAAQPPAPGPGPRPQMPPRIRQPRIFVQRALADLRQVKMALQGSQEDYGGHKDSALAACDKATQELEEIMKAMPKPMPPPQRTAQPPGNPLAPPPPPGANPPPAPVPAPPSAPPGAPPQP
jgi:hypothetical protein